MQIKKVITKYSLQAQDYVHHMDPKGSRYIGASNRVCAWVSFCSQLQALLQSNIQDQAYIANLTAGKIFQNRNQVEKFIIVCVREPAADGDGVLRMEDVRRRRVVNDNGVLEFATNLGKILNRVSPKSISRDFTVTYLDVVTLMVVTTFAE